MSENEKLVARIVELEKQNRTNSQREGHQPGRIGKETRCVAPDDKFARDGALQTVNNLGAQNFKAFRNEH